MTSEKATNDIELFFHCKKCIDELPDGLAPRDFVRIEAGWTKKGLQVWCVRHEENVISLDFMGQRVSTA